MGLSHRTLYPDADDPRSQGPASTGPPQLEILSRGEGLRFVRTTLGRSPRFKVFAAVFILVLAVGSAWNFSRTPIYRATATVLVEAPKGIGLGAGEQGADLQNVTAQGRVLLARDLLEETLALAGGQDQSVQALDPEFLRAMLKVRPIAETNLVELQATGSDPERLALLVNVWIETYSSRRQRQVQQDVDERLVRLQEEYDRLDAEKQKKAVALDQYRRLHNIDTLEQDGNQAVARLRSVTDELNTAKAEHIEAEAELAALEDAIATGEPVVPPSEQAGLDALQEKAAALRSRLSDLRKRYTRLYLESEPSLRELPLQLAQLEDLIGSNLADGRDYMKSQFSRAVARSGRQVEVLEQELAAARVRASDFTSRFARYDRLQDDLQEVDALHRDLEGRLMKVKAEAPQAYRQVEVLEWAFPPRIPVEPHYWRDFAYHLGAAALAALLAVLLFEFLTRRERDEDEMAPLTGVRVFGLAAAGRHPIAKGAAPAALEAGRPLREEVRSLPGSLARELLLGEVGALIALADPASRQLIGLLLSGLTEEECAGLSETDFDLPSSRVRAPTDGRAVELAAPLVADLERRRPLPLWAQASEGAAAEPRASAARLLDRLPLLAHDAGVARPHEVDAAALRHTYVCYLVRQGARLTEIERIVGHLPAAALARYGAYSPGGAAKPLESVHRIYPAVAGYLANPDDRGQKP